MYDLGEDSVRGSLSMDTVGDRYLQVDTIKAICYNIGTVTFAQDKPKNELREKSRHDSDLLVQGLGCKPGFTESDSLHCLHSASIA